MLNVFPKQRPHVKDILADPFFNHHKQLIESNSSNSTNLGSTDNSYSKSNTVSSKNGNIHDILKTINEREAKNIQNFKKKNNSGISKQYTVYSSTNGNSKKQKIFRFDSFKSGNSSYSSNQSPMHKNNVFYSFSSQNSAKRNNFSKSQNLQNNQPSLNSNFIKSVEVKNFKKQNQPQKFVVNNAFKKKSNPQTNKLSALKQKILNSKKGTNSAFSTFQQTNKKFQPRSIYKSPIQSKLRSPIQSNSEHKPISGIKWSQSHSSSRNTPQKWGSKKFVSYQSSKLGSKLIGKNNFSTHDPRKIKMNSQTNNYSSNKFTKLDSKNTKTNLLRISKGEPRSKFQNHAFKSVRNPASFSSSFQSQRGVQTFSNRNSSSSQGNNQGSFNGKKHTIQSNKTNFFKKQPVKSFVKFLQPKLSEKILIRINHLNLIELFPNLIQWQMEQEL